MCPIGETQVSLFARKDENIVIHEAKDLENYRIGVVRQDLGHQLMRDAIPEKDLDIASSSEANLRKLKEGRVDLFAYDLRASRFVLNKIGLNPDDYEPVFTLKRMPLCIAFNKDADDEIVLAFQQALDEILAERQ